MRLPLGDALLTYMSHNMVLNCIISQRSIRDDGSDCAADMQNMTNAYGIYM